MRAWLVLSLFATSCFPYRETYRPAMTGVVSDSSGAPVAGAQVLSCSETHWQQMSGCPRRAMVRTDKDGTFHFNRYTEWEWCCLGEAPLPHTVVVACTQDGRLAVGAPAGAPLALVLEPPPEKVDDAVAGPVDQCRAEVRVLPSP